METLVTYVTVSSRGKPVRSGARVSGALLTVGRAARCQIHLLDPRIALEHAQIAVGETGATITAPPGRIKVNGKEVDSAELFEGDRIELGPFVIEVAPRSDVQLSLAVTQVAASAPEGNPLRRIVRAMRPVPQRRLSYGLFIAILLGCLGAPVALDRFAAMVEAGAPKQGELQAGATQPRAVLPVRDLDPASRVFLGAWSPGPLMQSHQVFGANCRACHGTPFVQVRDGACLACHKELLEHTPRTGRIGLNAENFAGLRCAQCHRDHKGHDAVVRVQDMCAGCHRDIGRFSAGSGPASAGSTNAGSKNVADFARDHPPFRLALLDPEHPGTATRIRQDTNAALIERSNLKFNHKVHLDPAGMRTPAGRKKLACADCHAPNDDGMRMAPISMKRHCAACHALTFDPKVSRREVPHGPVEQVAATLRDFYSRQALGAALPRETGGASANAAGTAVRPGAAVLDYQERQNVLAVSSRQAERVLDELFGKRETCSRCHEARRIDQPPHWEVPPVRLASVWMPQARFTHAKHLTMECSACHAVAKSERARDIAMPDIAKCRECHVGARAVLGKVTSDCAACHNFHAGEEYWRGGRPKRAAEAGK